MSINSAMLAGVSGLTANSVALSSISDNIANVNTVGYKQAKTDFESLVTSQASGSSFQSGGVLAVNRQLISQQGLQTQTQSDLDLSISGQGFFVTTDHATNVTAADTRSFTRAGSFTKDDQGYLRNAAGFYLQGWPVNAQGNITTDPSDLTKLQSINVSQVGGAADLTTQIGINANLQSSQAVSTASEDKTETPLAAAASTAAATAAGAGGATVISTLAAALAAAAATPADATAINTAAAAPGATVASVAAAGATGATNAATAIINAANAAGATPASVAAAASAVSTTIAAAAYNPSTNSMAMYDGNNATGVKPDYSLQVPISDSKGGKRTVQIDFLKSATPNQWYAEIVAVPASDVVDGAGLTNGQISTGIVAFTADGKLDTANTTLFTGGSSSITFGASNGAAPGANQVNWAPSLGIDTQTVNFSISSATGGLTQFDSQSVTQSITTNGTAFGNLTKIEIDQNGFVTADFDNGVVRRIAQVAIATFPNPDGLTAVTGDAFRVTQASGTYNLKAPGTGGAGLIAPKSLESSTVDLSAEFTGLITTQRAYSASSKIITTADQMLQDLLNIIR
ncbi:MAG: flagellar hook-basal body complex protein [Proteobacteria bacterium]|nr:flagellar hook-basal body complex protein [Pseudomonadota bacterium]